MSDVVVLTQPASLIRYLGPYVASRSARAAGYRIKIIDFFTCVGTQLFKLLGQYVGPETQYLIISTTFLYNDAPTNVFEPRFVMNLDQFAKVRLNFWLNSEEELREWFHELRECLPSNVKICLAGDQVNKVFQYYEHIPEAHPLKQYVDLFLLGRDDDLLLNLLADKGEGFSILKDRFIVGSNAGTYKDMAIPTIVFNDDDVVTSSEILPIEISRGCAFNCGYCNRDKKTINKLSYEQLRAQFEHYYDRHGTTQYYFVTECFNDNLDFVKTFRRVTQDLPFKIRWSSCARTDMSIRHPEIIDMMAESGAFSNFYGIETINQETRKIAGRGFSLDQDLAVFKRLKMLQPDYLVVGFFIFGLPNDTRENILDTMQFLQGQDLIDHARIDVLNVEPMQEDLKGLLNPAPFSVDPAKYGFKELQFDPVYWKHATMDYTEAVELLTQWCSQRKDKFVTSCIAPLEYSMLGITRSDIEKAYGSNAETQALIARYYNSSNEHVRNYFRRLLNRG